MASCRLLLFIISTVSPISLTAQESTNKNVTLGSSIVANSNSTWTSPSGEFAFGFKQVAPGAFLLAIWFDQLPDKTLVWSANRDEPVPAGSTVHLSADGTLELFDQRNRWIWANQATSVIAQESLNRNVTLRSSIVANANANSTWTSPSGEFTFGFWQISPGAFLLAIWFDQIHDKTLVWSANRDEPVSAGSTVQLSTDGTLELVDQTGRRVWASHARSGTVAYAAMLDTGNLVLASNTSAILWQSFQLIFNNSGSINLYQQNGTLLRPLFESGPLVGQFYHRLVLEHDGVLRHYVYPKSANSSSAWSVRDFEPSNICSAVVERHTGGGPCGFNSYCSIKAEGRPSCNCPLNYYPRGGGLSGCTPDFVQQRCDHQQVQDALSFGLIEMYNIDWPFVDYTKLRNVDEDTCRQSCLSDCFCAIAIYSDGDCFKKSLPFSNGRLDSGFAGKALIKKNNNCGTEESCATCCSEHDKRSYEADVEDEGEAVLADWAYDCYQQGALDLLVAGDEEAKSDMKTLEIYVKTAIWCIQEDPTLRPHMNIVMHMLQGSMQVPTPPDPTAFIH
ncbi:hypothetical protein SASPL_119779 [Salvia splendens]|uniref:Bulb-type lectin domain-containing protein n=1 Tax=Salvia splendens TaxID=180675 RepID=A0A8X8XPB3_SALSN|nr:hypothetical protein SASPL_119779 [Salvia splendens]